MNDGWFKRAVDKLGFLLLFGWMIVWVLLSIILHNLSLFIVALIPLFLLISYCLSIDGIKWCEETWVYIRDGDDE